MANGDKLLAIVSGEVETPDENWVVCTPSFIAENGHTYGLRGVVVGWSLAHNGDVYGREMYSVAYADSGTVTFKVPPEASNDKNATAGGATGVWDSLIVRSTLWIRLRVKGYADHPVQWFAWLYVYEIEQAVS